MLTREEKAPVRAQRQKNKLNSLLKITSLCAVVDYEHWIRLAAIWKPHVSLVGTATIDFTDTETPTVFDLYVHEGYRANGIGTALLRSAMQWASQAGKSLYLHVRPDNPAYQLYLREGFELTGEVKEDGSLWMALEPVSAPTIEKETQPAPAKG